MKKKNLQQSKKHKPAIVQRNKTATAPGLSEQPKESRKTEALRNREKYLAPYWEKFNSFNEELRSCKANRKSGIETEAEKNKYQAACIRIERKKSTLISELLTIEPSHLSVDWIYWQIIEWMQDPRYNELVKDVFIKRKVPTEREQIDATIDWWLVKKIDEEAAEIRRLTGKQNVITEACKRIFDKGNIEWTFQELSGQIKFKGDGLKKIKGFSSSAKQLYQRYYAAKKIKPQLPWPYFGKDYIPFP